METHYQSGTQTLWALEPLKADTHRLQTRLRVDGSRSCLQVLKDRVSVRKTVCIPSTGREEARKRTLESCIGKSGDPERPAQDSLSHRLPGGRWGWGFGWDGVEGAEVASKRQARPGEREEMPPSGQVRTNLKVVADFDGTVAKSNYMA